MTYKDSISENKCLNNMMQTNTALPFLNLFQFVQSEQRTPFGNKRWLHPEYNPHLTEDNSEMAVCIVMNPPLLTCTHNLNPAVENYK